MKKTPTKQPQTGWIALGVVMAGLLLALVGVWLIGWGPNARAISAAKSATPTSAPPIIITKIIQWPSPTTAATTTPLPTATPLQPTPTVTQTTLPGETLDLVIVHTNDTWGYTRPCG